MQTDPVRNTCSTRSVLTDPRYLSPATDAVYESFAKSNGLVPESVTLFDGTKAHWIGSSKAEYVVVYFHGELCESGGNERTVIPNQHQEEDLSCRRAHII
jgi:hypothetical protein